MRSCDLSCRASGCRRGGRRGPGPGVVSAGLPSALLVPRGAPARPALTAPGPFVVSPRALLPRRGCARWEERRGAGASDDEVARRDDAVAVLGERRAR